MKVHPCLCTGGIPSATTIMPPEHGFTTPVYQIQCGGCGMAGPWKLSVAEAGKAWDAMITRAARAEALLRQIDDGDCPEAPPRPAGCDCPSCSIRRYFKEAP